MIILVKLILAHILGDFILQPNHWVSDKETHKYKSKYLYFHVLIHGILTLLFLWKFNIQGVTMVGIIMITHYLIDLMKLTLQKENTKRMWFFLDQFLHLLVLMILFLLYEGLDNIAFVLDNMNVYITYLTGFIFVSTPASIIMKNVMMQWTPIAKESAVNSLANAGKYIGILERVFVLGFIVFGYPQAIGFLITAKSVFRFGDLRESKNRQMTEYVLIGTLISFGIAIITGLMCKFLVETYAFM